MTLPRSPNTGQAVEYLRRSVERDKSADKDKGAGQRAANAEQAARDGVTIARTFDGDWGVSGGRSKRDTRHAMADLIEAIRAGEVSRIYCHTTDRLARDVEYGMALWNACKDAGAILRPGSQSFDPQEPGYLTLWTVLLAQAEEDLDRMTRKNQDQQDFGRDHAATCRLPGRPHPGRCHLVGCTDTTHCTLAHERGRRDFGELPGEDPAAVLAAFDAAGSFLGAAKALNAAGVRPRLNGMWSVRTVARIVRRERPDAPHPPSECPLRPERGKPGWSTWTAERCPHPHTARQGARASGRHILSGLLHCGGTYPDGRTCGGILSTMPRPDGRSPAYYCNAGKNRTDHSRPIVTAERFLLPWVKEEVARLRVPDAVTLATDNAAQRDALAGRLERAHELYIGGEITRERYDREAADVRAALDRLGAAESIVKVPPFDPAWPTPQANSYLRAVLLRVDLGPDMRPVWAEWRNRALRAD